MSITNMIKAIKQVHPKDVVIVKLGKFYNAFGKDAYIMSNLFGYKIKPIQENIYICGFPEVSINRVMAKLEGSKINFIIVDRRNNYDVDFKSDNGNLNKPEALC